MIWYLLKLLILLPLIKFEGMVWALCLAAMMIYAAVPVRWRRWGLVAAVLGAMGGALASRLRIQAQHATSQGRSDSAQQKHIQQTVLQHTPHDSHSRPFHALEYRALSGWP